jgi:mannose-1-phosphate guanylyltransferase
MLGVGKSLLRLTYERLEKVCPQENILVITNQDYVDLVKADIPEISDEQILAEPIRRNTAPCVSYVAHKLSAINPNANMIVAPSDHLIMDQDAFDKVIGQAIKFVSKKDSLVTLGMRPTRPDTGYGYIQYIEDIEDEGVYKVKTFTEKPTLEIAKTFMESGDFLWNSGIFVWSVRSILRAFAKHLPEIHDVFEAEDTYNTPDEEAFIQKAYSLCTNISIDYGVLEKANNVSVIPASFGWSDLGTWTSLYERQEKDYMGNAVMGKQVMVYDANNCMVVAPEDKMVVLQGLDDYIVVDSEDALLICHKSNEQQIKEITANIKRNKGDRYL